MTDIDRRTALLLSLLAPLAAGSAVAQAPKARHEVAESGHGDDQIAMLIFPQMTILDLIGPHFMFSSLMNTKLVLVAKSLEPVTSDSGVTVLPTATFASCPRDLTVLFTPGGTDGTLAAAKDRETLAFMADRGSRAKYVTSVCSGSLVLGAAGLLKGYKATSHWACRDALAGFGAIPTDARVVRDRNRITGAGVTAGIDFGLTMVAELRDQHYAECIQLMAEYSPSPPFNSGSLKTANADVKNTMVEMLAPFTKQANELAASASKAG
jgi:putative intracellular protease/amidase